MKKIKLFLIALAMLTSVSCSAEKNASSTAEPVSETVEVKQTLYKERKIALENTVDTPIKVSSFSNGYYYFYKSDKDELRLAVLDSEFNIVSDTALCGSINMGFSVNVNEDGSFCVISAVTDFEFEMSESGNIENYEDFLENGSLGFILTNYDSSGKVVSEHEIIGLDKEFDKKGSRLGDLCPYGEGKLILSYGNGLAVIGTDGSLLESQRYEMQLIDLGCDSDGKVIASEFHGFGHMDGETLALPEELLGEYDEMLKIDSCAMPGNNGFKAYFKRSDGIYGLTESGELVLVFDFTQSLVKDSDITCFTPCGDGMFLTAGNSSNSLLLYTRRPDDYTEDREIVDIWYISGGDGGQKITEFNKSNDKYLCKLNPSLKTPDDLTKAVLTDKAPDVIEYGSSDLIRKLTNLGALADMNELMDEYGSLEREELMPNVLEAFDMDGHIYALPEHFSIKTLFANSDYIGKEYINWTYDDLYRFYEERPEGMYLFTESWDGAFNLFCMNNLSAWIDTKNNTCKFGTPEFVKFLEFCKETKDSYIPEPNSAEGNADLLYQKQISVSLKDHTAMLCAGGIGDAGIVSIIAEEGRKNLTFDTASLLNFPENGGTGTVLANNSISVMESSDCKEGAWAYVSFLLGEERQCNNAKMGSGFNWVNKKAFDLSLSQCIHEGSEPEMSSIVYDGNDFTFKIDYPCTVTAEQAEEYRSFVMNCTKLKYDNNDVNNILYEEYNRFINDEITAEQCASYIQDRVEILLGEQQ
ncbi:MAG: extracellular solute-binding protein [Ruminococcus sp.]|nr:extracellular solute-binding protein [Ruminococcus sp.]